MARSFTLRTLVCSLWLAMSLWAQAPSTKGAPLIVGVLDDAREDMVNWKPGVAERRVIRPLFEKESTGWKEVKADSLPTQMSWTVAFDGKDIGYLKSAAGDDEFTPIQKILAPARDLPTMGHPSNKFAGIMGLGNETKFRRPLVVVSQPNFRDPDGWKPSKLPDDIATAIRQAFRREYAHVNRCKEEEILERDWKFPDSALSFPSAYQSNKNSYLAEVNIDSGDCGWIDQPDQPESGPWFFVQSDGVVRRIGSFLSLLDAGDYDNDGKSEVIFFFSQGENTDGLVLSDSSFQASTLVSWHYH